MSMPQDPAGEAFRAGDLAGAVAGAIAAVKARPREAGLRWLLAEMLLFSGETERADRALDAVIEAQPSPPVLEFRRLLRAAAQRQQTFREGRLPGFQGDDPTPAQAAALRALTLAKSGATAGDLAAAGAAAADAEALRPRCPGSADGVAFDDFRDADDVFAPQIEVLTSAGAYLWVPVERLSSLEFEPMRRPRDLAWRRCLLTLKDGTEGAVYLPAIYPQAPIDPEAPIAPEAGAEDALRLGRATDWREVGSIVRGVGQRVWLAGEAALSASEVGRLSFT